MRKIKDIKEVHKIVLNLAKAFHKICVKHNIPYYLHYGGLIGMVRHKGFIPWDDDLDFVVPRKYIKSLIAVLKEDLPDYYKIRDIDTDSTVWFEIIKIEDARTLIKEKGLDKPHGIFIDIFPMDYCRNDWRDKLLWHLRVVYGFEWHNQKNKWTILAKGIGLILGKNWLIHSVKYIAPKSGDYYAIYSCGYKSTLPVSVYGTPQLHDFEDTQLYCVEDYDTALKKCYGDYMQLPPENERQYHIEEAYYK